MKLYVNLFVFTVMSFPIVHAADTSFATSSDSFSLTQKPVSLILDKSSSEVKFSEVSVTCNPGIDTDKNAQINNLAKANQNISKFFTCTDNRSLNIFRFNSELCVEAIACRKNVSLMQVNSAGTDKLMNEIVAKDYAKNVLEQNAEIMDRLEVLKEFAKQKFDLKNDKCNSRYQPKKGGVCNLSLLDEVFVNFQVNCQFGNNCYKTDASVLSLADYREREKVAKSAFVVEYNEYRIDNKVKKSVASDSEYVNEMAELVTSEEFKKANAEQKGDMFLKKMETGTGDRYKDPVLAFDFDSVSDKEKLKKMMKFKQLVAIYDNKDQTKDSFISSFNDYRKKRAEAVLSDSGASCSEVTDIKKICEDMTALSLGKVLPKDPLSVEHLSSRNLKNDKKDFEKFKSLMGESFNEKDYDTLVNAKRCLSFGIASEEYNDMTGNKGPRSRFNLGTIVGEMAGPNKDAVDSSRENIASYFGESPSSKNDPAKAVEPKMGVSAEAESSTSLNDALAGTQATASSNFANQFNQSFTPGAYDADEDDKKEKVEKTEEVVAAANPASNPTTEKMNDLMKRLASAEEKVDKMKAANEEAEANRVKQKKIDEENALIKDLKNQISDLKAVKDKKETAAAVTVAAPVVEQPRAQSSNVYASSYNSGSSSAPSRQEAAPKAADNFDSGRAPSSVSNSNSSGGRSGMNSAILTSSGSADNNKAASTGIVITAIDGMTTEKATQTITNRILELNGTPFYIEEGGMVKEIIAVVKDGKVLLDDKGNPIYEKIVKGKVGDKKFAKIKEKGRAPAAITDAADLKRDQEEKLKRERAEYFKLKNLTNKVLKKD